MYQWVKGAAVRENLNDGVMAVMATLFAPKVSFWATNSTI
jgi:hypothetical protein